MSNKKEKKELKVSFWTGILIYTIFVLTIVGMIMWFFHDEIKERAGWIKTENTGKEIKEQEDNLKAYKKVTINDKTYYQKTSNKTWDGEYHQDVFENNERIEDKVEVVSYDKYLELIDTDNEIISKFSPLTQIKKYYNDSESNYIILCSGVGMSWCEIDLIDCIEENDRIVIFADESVDGVMASGSGYFIAIPTKMPVGTPIEYIECYSKEEINNIKKYDTPYDPNDVTVRKPIIYLYPTEETNVTVKVLNKELLTSTYPKYNNGWNVIAYPDGNLKDIETGRKLYSLYYESASLIDYKIEEGFVVKGEDSAAFLEEKLSILGLTEREAEEFIVYWLPQLESREYNYIRFATQEEIDTNMPLDINPKPDSVIRVLMIFKGLDAPIEVQEQHLEKQERSGFAVVEWGGTEIK